MTFYTYVHTKPDGTIFYIGKGQGKRATAKSGRNKHWHNLVNKHGLNVEILAHWDTEQEAYDHEVLLISCFRDMGYELANYKNGGEGGGCGNKHTEDFKLFMRNRFLGIPKTEQHKEKLRKPKSAQHKLKHLGKNNSKFKGSILATNKITGESFVITGNLQMKELGFYDTCVYGCVNGRLKSHKGHTFKRLEV